jgi:hypothetical protein
MFAVTKTPPKYLRGQIVEVKSAAEIAATLDADGALDGLPFMPEMAAFCGRRLTVRSRVDRTCVEGHGLRRLHNTLLLEDARCDGALHDGCQRNCLIFWKEAWLKPASETDAAGSVAADTGSAALVSAPVRRGELYHCQSTVLAEASDRLPRWNIVGLFGDVARGELSPAGLVGMLGRTVVNRVRRLAGLPEVGLILGEARAPKRGKLRLAPGEWVRIKSADEIKKTLGPDGRNRGLTFEPEMAAYLGRRYQVDFPVEKIIHEETGKMIQLSSTVALKDLYCSGACVKNCPRANPLYWREAWLERVEPAAG